MAAGNYHFVGFAITLNTVSQRLFDFSFTAMTLPKIKKVFSKAFTPGISQIDLTDKASMRSYLTPILHHAKLVLEEHEAKWGNIPLYLRTTGIHNISTPLCAKKGCVRWGSLTVTGE